MSHDEFTEEDLAAGLRALADSAEHTAMETRVIGQRLGILPPDENPRPQTVGAALAAFDGSQRALRAALGELSDARDGVAALVARIAALEAQIALAQRDNTKLIARIVELEHQLETASGLIIRYARLVGMQMESISSFPSVPDQAPRHDP